MKSRVKEGYIYFLQGESADWVKVGFTTDLKKRLHTHQCGSPEKLKYIGYHKGTSRDEKQLHKRFESIRRRGEWFDCDSRMLAYIFEYCERSDLNKYNK